MIGLLIYMWINIGKMNALHKERMKLMDELSALMDVVQRERRAVIQDLLTVKRMKDDIEEVIDTVEARKDVRPQEPPV